MSATTTLDYALDEQALQILERQRTAGVVRRRGWLMRRMLLAADLVGLASAFVLAEWVDMHHGGPTDRVASAWEFLIFLGTLPAWIVVAKIYGLYDRDEERTDHTTVEDMVDVFHVLTVGAWLLYGFSSLTGVASPTTQKLFIFWLAGIAFVATARGLARSYCRRQLAYLQNTVIVGAGQVGQMIARKYLEHPEYGVNLVGFVDAHPRDRGPDLAHLALLGGLADLPRVVRQLDVERVLIAFSAEADADTLRLIDTLRELDVQVDIVPRLFEGFGPNVSVHMIEGFPLVGLPPLRLSRSSLALKRGFDCAGAAFALLVVGPLLIAIAVAILLTSAGTVFYVDERVGRNGRIFRAFKFRTMIPGAEDLLDDLLSRDPVARAEFDRTHKLQADPRVSQIGKWLRKTSLDELPQLFNVLRGDLSLVGPRAVTCHEHQRYVASGTMRGDAVRGYWETGFRPGVTGYWQINGRSDLTYDDRLRLDLSYIHSWSLALDVRILARTVRVLLSRRGAR